ncbi:MAG: tyrosine--tRNA ligase [Candidatus Bilamarchaeaceae archaeon]
MDIEKKIELVARPPTKEIVSEKKLREVFEKYSSPRAYDGFEISGFVHLGTGLCTALKIRDFMEAGIKPIILLADYHSWINEKLGGDLDKIRKVGMGYFKHAFVSLGLDEEHVEYVLASSIYDNNYWADVLRITKETTINRMLRCVTIMGRKETEITKAAAMIYPAMQVADVFKLNVQLAFSGMDQRKAYMLAIELAKSRKYDFVSVHGHLLPSLQGIQRMNPTENDIIDAKMSKSKPSSAIFIHDSEDEIKSKIGKAYCPEKMLEGNPIIEYAQYLIIREKPLKVERPAKFGGDIEFVAVDELRKTYAEGKLHPLDLKNAVARELIDMLKPSRDYFAKHKEYLEQMKLADITR